MFGSNTTHHTRIGQGPFGLCGSKTRATNADAGLSQKKKMQMLE
jgi:hypothetical protein